MDQPKPIPVAPTASAMVARFAVEEFEARGVDCGAVLAGAGVSRSVLLDADARLPLAAYNAILEGAFEAAGDPAIAVDVGRHIPIAAYRIVGYCAAAADTLRGGLAVMGQYFALLKGGFDFHIVAGNGPEHLEYRSADPAAMPRAVAIIGTAAVLAFAEAISNQPFRPALIRFPFPAPGWADRLVHAFGTALSFDAPQVEIHPAPGALDVPTRMADPTLRERFDQLARAALETERRVQEYTAAMAALDRALQRARAALDEARRGPRAPRWPQDRARAPSANAR